MLKQTGLLVDDLFLRHDTTLIENSHPENPGRLRAIAELFREKGLIEDTCSLPVLGAVDDKILALAHSQQHILEMKNAFNAGLTKVEEETPVSAESEIVARKAIGSAIGAADMILSGDIESAFCAIRPPGHHALSDRPMGFCIYNNAAVVARYLTEIRGLERVLILDWDVHHGNGTQEILERDPKVYFCSIHGDTKEGFYPGFGGTEEEIGIDQGKGSILNLPMKDSSSELEYLDVLNQKFMPWALRFKPQFIIISAGFDAVNGDPLGNMLLQPESYTRLTSLVLDLAKKSDSAGVLSLLEGGYNLELLAKSAAHHVSELMR